MRLWVFAAAFVIGLFPQLAHAEGALAFVNVPDVGYSAGSEVNWSTAAQAEAEALQRCGETESPAKGQCEIVANLHRNCAAVAAGSSAAAWAVADTQEAAESRALASCQTMTGDCEVTEVTDCDTNDGEAQ